MIKVIAAGFLATLLGTEASAQAYNPPRNDLPPAVQRQVDLAYLLSDGRPDPDYLPTLLGDVFGVKMTDTPLFRQDMKTPMVGRAFDNLYYVGFAFVGTWAVKTSKGIILFDTLDNADEARTVLVPGLAKLGLKISDVKYIVITHGHFDHVGGAKYLQDTYHIPILMSGPDWDMIEHQPPAQRPFQVPKRDIVVTDGYDLSLGDTHIKLYVTPGHTPGTISAFLKVADHGREHVALFWGGNGMPRTLEPNANSGGLLAYRSSLLRFARLAIENKADAIISNHPITDNTVANLAQIKAHPGKGSPWVLGHDAVMLNLGSNIAAIDAGIASKSQP